MTKQSVAERKRGILERVGARVEEFLSDLEKKSPHELDCLELEREAVEVVKHLGLQLMQEVFQAADELAPQIVVHGAEWGNRRPSKGTYTTKFGSFSMMRSGYQQSGRGAVLFAVDKRLGIVEGRYTPAMASVMAHTVAQMPAEDGERFLTELGFAQVSKSTLHRIPQDMSAVLERDRVEIEAAVRAEWHVPEGTHTIQAGMDGVMLPMEGEETAPRGRKTATPALPRHERHYGVTTPRLATKDDKRGIAYHEASVGTLSCYDAAGEHLTTVYVARMPEYRKESLAAMLEEELKGALEQCQGARVALASDGAPTHWEHLAGMQARLPAGTESRQLLDFCHGAKYLFDAAKLVESDPGVATATAESWRADLRHREDGPEKVLRSLRYRRDECGSESVAEELETIIEYFAEHKKSHRLDYAAAANDAYPIGTGTTEAAAKAVVNVRMKRAGARYETHGGQTILNFRAALMSDRFSTLMREIVARYSAKVEAA